MHVARMALALRLSFEASLLQWLTIYYSEGLVLESPDNSRISERFCRADILARRRGEAINRRSRDV